MSKNWFVLIKRLFHFFVYILFTFINEKYEKKKSITKFYLLAAIASYICI